jgi:HTH-type transcriptional regulator/antitoxin HigA
MTEEAMAFEPDWLAPPGDTMADVLEERGWSQAEFAQRIGCTTKHVNQLIRGKATISEDAALHLERVLGSTARFWLQREAEYREALARRVAQFVHAAYVERLAEKLRDPEFRKIGLGRIVEQCYNSNVNSFVGSG